MTPRFLVSFLFWAVEGRPRSLSSKSPQWPWTMWGLMAVQGVQEVQASEARRVAGVAETVALDEQVAASPFLFVGSPLL